MSIVSPKRRPTGHRYTSWWVGLTTGLLLSSTAWADERVEARRHFTTGMTYIGQGNYDQGIAELLVAYDILPHPVVMYNIGKAYFDKGDFANAEIFLQRYLTTNPADKAEAEKLLARAREEQARTRAAALQPQATAPVVIEATAEASPSPLVAGASKDDLQALATQLQDIVQQLNNLSEKAATPAPANPQPQTVTQNVEVPPQATPPSQPSGTPVSTQPQGRDPYGQVVITSSRYQQSPMEAPNALTILTREDIRQSGSRTLPDLLRRVPGLEVMALTPGDYNVGIRGFNSTLANKVLVLVDGRTVYLDFVGATLWPMMSISLSDIERIEVIRGPGAALYGANAFSGVINIITRSPGDPTDRTEVDLRSGIPDWSDGSLHVTGRAGTASFRASAGFETVERWSFEIDPNRPDYQIQADSVDDATRLTRLDARVDQHLGDKSNLSLSGGVTDGQVEFTAIGAVRDFYIDGRSSYLRADLQLPEGISYRVFWNHLDVDAGPWAIPTGGLDLSSRPQTDSVDMELQQYREIKGPVAQRLNVGLGYRYKTIDWLDYLTINNNPVEHHLNFFVQDEAKITRDVTVVGSLRVDRHPLLADPDLADPDEGFLERYPTSPRGAVIWRIDEDQALRATVGTAFRQPTFLESYIHRDINTSTDAVVVVSQENQRLNPERILSAEVGYLTQPGNDRYEVEAVGYYNRVTDLIQLGGIGPLAIGEEPYDETNGVWRVGATNQVNLPGVYTAIGGEIGTKLYPRDGLDLYANYSYEIIRSDVDCRDEDGNPTANAPVGCKDDQGEAIDGPYSARVLSTSPNKLNGGIQFRSDKGIELGLDASFVQEQIWTLLGLDAQGQRTETPYVVPTYTWVTARLGYRSPSERLELSVQGNNLLALAHATSSPAVAPTPDTPGDYGTPQYTHREHPLGQTIPVGFSASLVYRF